MPEDFPPDTLVTGSVFKFLPRRELVDPLYLVAYLSGRFGRTLRTRTLSNTLIGFVSKADLYAIPVPILDDELQKTVARGIAEALEQNGEAYRLLDEAEAVLHEVLPDVGPPGAELTTIVRYPRVRSVGRLDAEFFQPEKWRCLEALNSVPASALTTEFDVVRETLDPKRANRDFFGPQL